MSEPRWRSFLCWGAVLTFLTMPLMIFALAFISQEYGWTAFHDHVKDYKFLSPYFQSVTALVFGLAGLRSLDKYTETKSNGKNPPNAPH
jgi:hypothetical protein